MGRTNRSAVGVFAAVLLAGCASAGGHHGRIRQLQEGEAAACKYLGATEVTERSGWDMSDAEMGATPAIRKRVTEMGGNAFVLTHSARAAFGAAVQADVYRCR